MAIRGLQSSRAVSASTWKAESQTNSELEKRRYINNLIHSSRNAALAELLQIKVEKNPMLDEFDYLENAD